MLLLAVRSNLSPLSIPRTGQLSQSTARGSSFTPRRLQRSERVPLHTQMRSSLPGSTFHGSRSKQHPGHHQLSTQHPQQGAGAMQSRSGLRSNTSTRTRTRTRTSDVRSDGETVSRETVIQSTQKTTVNFAFSASGLMFVYYVGVVMKLQEAGILTDASHIAGCSGGGVIGALVACGVPMAVVIKEVKDLYRDLDANTRMWSFFPRIEGHLRPMLDRVLPTDAHERVRGKCSIQLTQVWPLKKDPSLDTWFQWRPFGKLVDRFESRDELIDAMIATTYLPGPLIVPALGIALAISLAVTAWMVYLGKWAVGVGLLGGCACMIAGVLVGPVPFVFSFFKRTACWDGALTCRLPPLPGAVKVSAFVREKWSDVDIFKGSSAEDPAHKRIDIYPDCIKPLEAAKTYTPEDWFKWVFNVPTPDQIDMIIDTGYQGTASWVKQQNEATEQVKG